MEYITETALVKVVIETEFGVDHSLLILVHDKQLQKVAPLALPDLVMLPMDAKIVDSLIESLTEIRRVSFF